MKAVFCVLALVAAAGVVNAQYTSVVDAIRKMPELSQLAPHIKGNPLEKALQDPAWVGTVFAPTNAALDKISEALGGMDLFSMISDPEQIESALGSAIVEGKALMSSQLTEGMKLKTKGGETVTVSFKNPATIKPEAGGKTIYIDRNPVTQADIAAGKAVVYLMASPVLSSEYQDMLDSLSGQDSSLEAIAEEPAAPTITAAKTTTATAEKEADEVVDPDHDGDDHTETTVTTATKEVATEEAKTKAVSSTPSPAPAAKSSEAAASPAPAARDSAKSSAGTLAATLTLLAVPAVAALML